MGPTWSPSRRPSPRPRSARAGKGPTLIEAVTSILGGSTLTNEGRQWRSDAELAEWRAKDPIQRMRARLLGERTLTEAAAQRIASDARAEAEAAAEFMRTSPDPDPSGALRNIRYEGPR